MNSEEIGKAIKDKFGEAILEDPSDVEGRLLIKVTPESLREVATYTKHELGFTYGDNAHATDTKEVIEMSWYVGHPDSHLLIVLRSDASRDEPILPSLKDLWIGFDWHEREAYDLLGIKFEGHDDLRRIYMPDNWEGHPLREDYVYKRPQYHKPEDEVRN